MDAARLPRLQLVVPRLRDEPCGRLDPAFDKYQQVLSRKIWERRRFTSLYTFILLILIFFRCLLQIYDSTTLPLGGLLLIVD